MKFFFKLSVLVMLCGMTAFAVQIAPPVTPQMTRLATVSPIPVERPQYRLHADIDWELLTFRGTANIVVPVAPGDSINTVSCFIYANASGVGGASGSSDDERRKNIAVDKVTFAGRDCAVSIERRGFESATSIAANSAF